MVLGSWAASTEGHSVAFRCSWLQHCILRGFTSTWSGLGAWTVANPCWAHCHGPAPPCRCCTWKAPTSAGTTVRMSSRPCGSSFCRSCRVAGAFHAAVWLLPPQLSVLCVSNVLCATLMLLYNRAACAVCLAGISCVTCSISCVRCPITCVYTCCMPDSLRFIASVDRPGSASAAAQGLHSCSTGIGQLQWTHCR